MEELLGRNRAGREAGVAPRAEAAWARPAISGRPATVFSGARSRPQFAAAGSFCARFVAATARESMVDGWGWLGFWRFVIGE